MKIKIFFLLNLIFFSQFLALKLKPQIKNDKLQGNNMTNLRLKETINSDNKKISSLIKCLYIEDYGIYDLSELTKDKATADGLKDYSINLYGNTIYYNFCIDIHKETCPNLKNAQTAFLNPKEKNCIAKSQSIEIGNQWNIDLYNKSNPGNKDIISITLAGSNDTKLPKFIYKLECDDNETKYKNNKFEIINDKCSIKDNETILYFKTYYACPIINFYDIGNFIEKNKYFFAVVMIIVGLTLTFLGSKFIKLTVYIILILALILIALFILAIIPATIDKNWIFWIVLSFAIILGTGLAFCMTSVMNVFYIVLGIISGILFGQFVFNFFAKYVTWHPKVIFCLVLLACIAIMILLSLKLGPTFILISTSIVGAYLTIRGISFICGHFPSESLIMDLARNKEYDQLKKLVNWRVILYLVAMLILAVLGVIAQIYINKKWPNEKEKDEIDEDERKPLKYK